MRKSSINIKKIYCFLIAAMTLVECNTLYSFLIGNKYITVATAAILVVSSIYAKKLKKNDGAIVLLFLSASAILLVSYAAGDYKPEVFAVSVMIPIVCYFILFQDKRRIEYVLNDITELMIIISAISLFFFIFGTLLNIVHPNEYFPSSRIGWGGEVGGVNYRGYYRLYFQGTLVNFFRYSGFRNTAVFVEGPMFVYPLSIAIYNEWNLRAGGPRKKALAIMIAAMLTSFTTTGYLALLLIFVFNLFTRGKSKKFLEHSHIVVGVIAVGILGFNIVSDKYVSGTISVNKRIDDISSCFKAFIAHPLIGIGYNNIRGLDPFRSVLRVNAGLSTGLGALFAFGGIFLGVWYIIPPIWGIRKCAMDKNFLKYYGLIILSTFLLTFTVIQFSMMNAMLTSIGWAMCLSKHNKRQVLR